MSETPDLKELIEQPLVELLNGKAAHASPLACLEDLSSGLAGRKVEGHAWSIWEIVLHLNYWMAYDLKRILGAPDPYPDHAANSWPPLPPEAGEESWSHTVSQFASLLQEWETLSRSDLQVLTRSANAISPRHAQQASSVLALILQTIAHNSYHLGQIVLTRRALEAWPPRKGGDTW
jgi:hypothetical protein